MLGVEWNDEFRFKLIDEDCEKEVKEKTRAASHTEYITAYTVYQHSGSLVPYPVTIVDTPGFGDTRGIDYDQMVVTQLKHFFSTNGDKGIDHLDVIGFVTQAPLVRLTPTQR